MMRLWRGLSIQAKLCLLLILLPALALGAYVTLAIRLFEDDKLAYVHDSSASVSQSLAAEVAVEILLAQSMVRPLLEGFGPASRDFDPSARGYFAEEPKIAALLIRDGSAAGGTLLSKLTAEEELAFRRAIGDGAPEPGRARVELWKGSPRLRDHLLLDIRVTAPPPASAHAYQAVALVQAERLAAVFRDSGAYQSYLVDARGTLVLGPAEPQASFVELLPRLAIGSDATAGSFLAGNGSPALASIARVASTDLRVVSIIERRVALQAAQVLLAKSLVFFVLLLAVTVILSVVAARALTSALSSLHRATLKVADGDFDVRVSVISGDEVGDLARSFNEMAKRIAILIRETAEKVRMAGELETARLVQERLFPAATASYGPLEIAGTYESATECGGDWWYHCVIQERVFIWLGDAMGHGVAAALITGAVRAVAAAVESVAGTAPQGLRVPALLALLNRAVHQSAKGQMTMTFFLAAYDPASGELIYSNASQTAPYLYSAKERALRLLAEANDEPLGLKAGTLYGEARVLMRAGDVIILYTDGVVDLLGSAGERLGRKRAREIFQNGIEEGGSAERMRDRIVSELRAFRGGSLLDDDVSILVCRQTRPV